ncbi:Transcription factor e(y)2 [Leishmania donovani]|nr:Transcription_factor_e(y)2_-_putative [Leishmania infantum]CAJ1986227.1 Transcription factor e(y)2 [Leishmania donovani]SUZ39176.1 Transcription_factor_e(y)2_-_putative [Leishmania infantum]
MATSAEDGHVAYEALTNAQKAELAAWVRNQLDSTNGASQWRRHTQAMIRQAMARRAASGAPLDAGDILEEIMPHVRSAIPPEVREGLFRRVTAQLHL